MPAIRPAFTTMLAVLLREHNDRTLLAGVHWWVPTDAHPQPARADQRRTVELQGRDGCTTGGSQTKDFGTIIAPCEMLAPCLMTWVEEMRALICLWIGCCDPICLMPITYRAGRPQVVLFGLPTQRLRDDVIDLHWNANDRLLREAIAATVAGLGGDTLSKGSRDVGFPHVRCNSTETSCPRSWSNAAACARMSIARSYWRISAASVCDSCSVNPSRCCFRWRSSSSAAASAARWLRAARHKLSLSKRVSESSTDAKSADKAEVSDSDCAAAANNSSSMVRRVCAARL
jgi:hypothetical protein